MIKSSMLEPSLSTIGVLSVIAFLRAVVVSIKAIATCDRRLGRQTS